ncbi:MAG: hypothetical protein GYA46_11205 [candidate division Zixibacteria bacterium]|nr:hypothetical protein [candidate division Zixibacteria bacterium]
MQATRLAGTAIRRILIAIVMMAMTIMAGCSDENPLGPYQPEIGNNPDNFQFQVTAAKNVTTTIDYTWQNSSTAASINQASSIRDGAASITLFDANGTQVYTKDLNANGTYSSAAGAAGTWTVRVVLTNLYGTLNFRVQKL